jgi:hypothetical protein
MHAMRSATKSTLQLASLTLLASLAACSSTPTNTGGGGADAGSTTDVQTAADTGTVTTDTGTATTDTGTATTDVPPTGDAGASACPPSAEAATFVRGLAAGSWAALNRSRSMMMYGCAGATRAQDCLADRPLVSDDNIGASASVVPGAKLRVLFTAEVGSTYWSRSSPDGRFVARGTKMRDLVRDVEMDAVGAQYDPAFFPDATGFMYQPGGRLCPMSMLTTGMPTSLPMMGAGSQCVGSSIGLYEHLAAGLGGEDYWASYAGTAAFDDGGRRAQTTDARRNEAWTASARVALSLMANTGSGFRFVATRNVTTPFQGDAVISPSSRALVTMSVDEAGTYQGYVLHRLEATHAGSAITANITELARYCFRGAKVSFSYDERYIIYHHYIGGGQDADADAQAMGFTDAADPRFAEYTSQGAANIYLLDLATGRNTRLTNMRPGQYALFPHFRSDGWIYFLVRTLGTRREHVIASDAALILP